MASRTKNRANNRIRAVTMSEEEEEFRRMLDTIPPPTPPDGGWGWLVVFSSFMINAIVDGFCHCYGIFLPELIHFFNKTEIFSTDSLDEERAHKTLEAGMSTPTALIGLGGALLLGVYMLSGPLTSALCNRFGGRKIAMYGSLLATFGLILSTFSDKPPLFLILFGILGGLGFGMMFLAAIVVVGFYFEKHRSLAATLAMCGSGVGTAFMAPFLTYLFEDFRWKSVLLLSCGIILQGMVLGAFYKPLDADFRRRRKLIMKRMEEDSKIGPQTCVIIQRMLEEKRRNRTISTGSLNGVIITRDNVLIRADESQLANPRRPSFLNRLKGWSRSNLNIHSSKTNAQNTSANNTPTAVHKNLPDIVLNSGTDSPQNTGTPMSVRKLTFGPRQISTLSTHEENASTKTSPETPRKAQQSGGAAADASSDQTQDSLSVAAADNISLSPSLAETMSVSTASGSTQEQQNELVKKYINHVPPGDRPMYRKDILYSGSVQQLPQYTKNIDEYVSSITHIPAEDPALQKENCCWAGLSCLPKSIRDVLYSILDPSTFSSKTFILLSISSFLTMLGYFVPFLLLPGYASQLGAKPMDSALLFTALGGSNTLGRLLAGAFKGKRYINAVIVNNVALIMAGGVTLAVPYIKSLEYLYIYVSVFGLCIAAFSSLRSEIVVELMGLDKLTTAFGQLIILHGLAVIIGTPVAALLYDLSGSYSQSFYMAGSCIAMSGLLCIPLRKLTECERSSNNTGNLLNSSLDDSSIEETKKELPSQSSRRLSNESPM